MTISISISGNQVEVLESSLDIDDAVGERSTASFVVYDETGEDHYVKDEPVTIMDGTTTIFTGYLDKPVEKYIIGTGGKREHFMTCKDQHYLADKRIAAQAYENKTCGYIVNDLITKYLAAEGVTVGNISEGATLVSCIFNYINVSRCMDSLTEKSNFIWFIDYDKKLYFIPKNTIESPWTVGSSDMLADSVSLDKGNNLYRNKQYIRGGKDITDVLTQKFKGDGETQTFPVGFPIAKVPTVKVDNVVKTMGIRNVDSGKDWYWSKGEKEITQDSDGTKLTDSNTLEVDYQGEFDIVAVSSDFGEISTKATIEGSSGIVEDVADENYINNKEDAFQSANAKLTKYGKDSYKLQFTTLKPGLKAGQMAPVNVPEYSIATDMLVESVKISTGDNLVYYDVTLVLGVENQSWAKMFESMATRGETFVVKENISENEVLITLHTFSKTWLSNTANNIFKQVFPGSTTYPGATTICGFEVSKRVLYIELLTSGNVVLIRKRITKQTGTTTLVSTTFINSSEANGAVAKVRWYGGEFATEEAGTGTLVDEQAFVATKTYLEAYQIEKTDTKGW